MFVFKKFDRQNHVCKFTVEDLLPVTVKLNMPPRIPSHRQMTTNEFFSDSRYCLGSYYSRDENRTVQKQ